MKEEYDGLLKSGMFWEFYPSLSGEWDKDKEEWSVIFKRLQELRKELKNRCHCDRGSKVDGEHYCKDCLKENPLLYV